jgi:hypothetical protein
MIIVSKISEYYYDVNGNLVGIIFFPMNEDPIIWYYCNKELKPPKTEC